MNLPTMSKGSHRSLKLRLPALRAGLAIGAALTTLALSAGRAEAYVVTVGGVQYEVTTFTGKDVLPANP